MANQKLFNVAVVGATGAVGEQILRLLEERDFPIKELKLLSSPRSAGKKLQFKDREIVIEAATPDHFKGVDIALFSAGGSISLDLIPHAVASGAICIDNTSAYRMDPNTPLVVPEVNGDHIRAHQGIIANPNCSTIQMVAALKPLYDRYGISRIIVSTYQAVSGAGAEAIEELLEQSQVALKGDQVSPQVLPVSSLPVKHQIAFNVIPQIDQFDSNGFTLEEMKMVNETKKIFADDQIAVTATCVRIPVVYGHSESVYVQLKEDFDLAEVENLLAATPGIVVQNNSSEQQYPMPLDAAGKKEVFVGRLRKDLYDEKGLNMWIVSDNLLKGAAWNAVQIAEYVVEHSIVK